MNEVKWLLENDVFDEDLQPMIDEIKRQGMEVKVQRHIPFEQERDDILVAYPQDDCVVFYGSIGFARQVQSISRWRPGAYCNWDNYRCTHYYPAFGDLLLNADRYVMMPLGELVRHKDFLYETLGEDNTVFVRPDRADKIFTGKAVYRPDLERDVKLFGFYDVEPHELVVVSPPKNITKEFRMVIVDDEIVAVSQYRPEHIVPSTSMYETVRDMGRLALSTTKWRPDRAWVMDVCHTAGGDQRILEVGAFSVAGLYACDPKPIVRAVSAAAFDEWSR